jgi:hypothetical protein
MSGFTDMMIDAGFSDPQEFMDYLEGLAVHTLSEGYQDYDEYLDDDYLDDDYLDDDYLDGNDQDY